MNSIAGGSSLLAEELSVIDADAPLWDAVRPLLAAALQLEQNGDAYSWHGWHKQQVCTFLESLPLHCTLVVGVWDTILHEDDSRERELLVLGCVCEVMGGELHSLRTFEVLTDAALPAIEELEAGFEHAREIMRAVKHAVAPVAWALFTDKATWDTWLLATADDGGVIDKGALLAQFARQGRCVLMGSQTMHHHQ
ncbi:MAG: hypothetical protein E6J34_14355 [Chloroflexi bacterium]|nr:MAG: hypothetical protein E6J34_14355 [Chloroflexota bacterium]